MGNVDVVLILLVISFTSVLSKDIHFFQSYVIYPDFQAFLQIFASRIVQASLPYLSCSGDMLQTPDAALFLSILTASPNSIFVISLQLIKK